MASGGAGMIEAIVMNQQSVGTLMSLGDVLVLSVTLGFTVLLVQKVEKWKVTIWQRS